MDANTNAFLADPAQYFASSYAEFAVFGGPCVYFHEVCLHTCTEEWLSERDVQFLYAALTASGMHRMGDPAMTRAKLTEWEVFSRSILEPAGGARAVPRASDA